MQPYMWIILAVVVIVLVIALVVVTGRRNRRRDALRERFGPEYDLAVKRGKDRRAVEQRLEALSQRRDTLDIRDIAPEEHVRFAQQWDEAQGRFVDDPGQAVADADGLVNSVLRSRGYPVESFDDRAAMVATDHQDVVEGYRSAHDVFAAHLQGSTGDTEQLRQAFLHYREVFGRLNVPRDDPAERGRHALDAPPVEQAQPAVQTTAPVEPAAERVREPIPEAAAEPATEPAPQPAGEPARARHRARRRGRHRARHGARPSPPPSPPRSRPGNRPPCGSTPPRSRASCGSRPRARRSGAELGPVQNRLPRSRASSWARRRAVSASAVTRFGRKVTAVWSVMPAQSSQSSRYACWKSLPKPGRKTGPYTALV